MALVGQVAPKFHMGAVDGQGHDMEVSLKDYQSKWLVLFFYPHDFTFVCPTEIIALSEAEDAFTTRGAKLLGVSTDSSHVHRAWRNADPDQGGLGAIRYPLASDVSHEVSKAYQVYVPEEGAAYRGLFIIDPDGVVQYEVVHNLNVGRSVDEVLRVLDGLQAGGLCPVNWKPGDQLL